MREERGPVVATLQELCADMVPVTIMSRDLLVSCYGRFRSVDEQALVVELVEPAVEIAFQPPSLCIVTFPRRGAPGVFAARIRRNLPASEGPSQLVLEVPKGIGRPESRLAFRVPVSAAAGLKVHVTSPGLPPWPARAIDMSMCGVLVDFSDGPPRELAYNQDITVDLVLGEHSIQMRGAVRRRRGQTYGLFFPGVMLSGDIKPPPQLKNIIEKLDAVWQEARKG